MSLTQIVHFNPGVGQARSQIRKTIITGLLAGQQVVSFYASMGVYHAARALRWLADKVAGAHSWVWNADFRYEPSSTAADVRTMIDALRRFREAYGSPVPFDADPPDGGDHAA